MTVPVTSNVTAPNCESGAGGVVAPTPPGWMTKNAKFGSPLMLVCDDELTACEKSKMIDPDGGWPFGVKPVIENVPLLGDGATQVAQKAPG